MTEEIQILVALNDSPASFRALDAAVKHVLSLKSKYNLYLIHFVALNPPQNLPYLDHLDKGFNLEIQEEEDKIIDKLASKLQDKYYGKVNYSFIKVEGNGELGPIIEEYIQAQLPNLDMVYVGTRNHGVLKKWALGSTSDYLVHHLKAPVAVVKDNVKYLMILNHEWSLTHLLIPIICIKEVSSTTRQRFHDIR